MKINLLLVLAVLLCSCSNPEHYFEEFVSAAEDSCVPSYDLTPRDKWKNVNPAYYRVFRSGPKMNQFLLEKAKSEKPTKWHICPFPFYLTEGDISINLLIDINNINFDTIIPDHLIDEYHVTGAGPWWEFLRENTENREIIIRMIREQLADI